ncbi:MAG: hypothetical protein ACYS8W_17330 [Planctomycetota bacterium]|jgi:hypothetical protein
MKNLSKEILEMLIMKLGIKESTIRQNISKIRRKHPACTLNAAAQLFAMQHRTSVLRKLDTEDRASLPSAIEIKRSKAVLEEKKPKKREKIIKLIDYTTDDPFIKGHINEVNLAYTKRCYTSANILARKIIENLIIDILRAKFPPKKRENKELYFDISHNRYKFFSEILGNLYKKRNEFGVNGSKIVKRLHSRASKLKDFANDTTHSWYYLIQRKKEIDDWEINTIIDLIEKLEECISE